jgi:hypothetical protein
MRPVRQLSAPSGQNGQRGNVKARVHTHLDANPGLEALSVNQVHTALKEAGVHA